MKLFCNWTKTFVPISDHRCLNHIYFWNPAVLFLKRLYLNYIHDLLITYIKVVSFTFEFSWGVHFVCHDSGNGFFQCFHPFCKLGVPHVIDLFDELVIFLPESHFGCLSCLVLLKRSKVQNLYWSSVAYVN